MTQQTPTPGNDTGLPTFGTGNIQEDMRDHIVTRIYVAMGALSYVTERVADVANEEAMPEGLRETVQAVTENYHFHVALLVEWAEKVKA